MGGRFFTVPLLLSTVIIVRYSRLDQFKKGIPAILVFLITSFLQPNAPILTGADYSRSGVPGERKNYYEWTSLLNWRPGKQMPSHKWANQGREDRAKNKKMIIVRDPIGMYGFFAGPLVHVVDKFALSNPLLSHIPPLYSPWIVPGHFTRCIPEGYLETISGEENKIKDPHLARFYDYIRIITRGPIFSWERFKIILKMNLGLYDYLIDEDRYRFAYSRVVSYEQLRDEIQKLDEEQSIKIPERGLEIRLGEEKFNKYIQIELRNNLDFHVLFFKNKEFLSRVKLSSSPVKTSPYTNYIIKVPDRVSSKGYDTIRIFACPFHRISILKGGICSYMKDIQLLPE